MQAWTDYPFENFGDASGKPAPVREVQVLSYDGDKYCRIKLGDFETEVKAGYLYSEAGRHGDVPIITTRQLGSLPVEL